MREYATRRCGRIVLQVKEIGSGASQREKREKLLEAARRREIDVVLVWRLDRWGRSVTDLLATLQELEHLGVGFVSLTEALDLTTPAGRAMASLLAVFAEFEREILWERVRAGLAHARQNGQRLVRPVTAAIHADQVAEALPCGQQQIRNRPPAADWPHLGASCSERKGTTLSRRRVWWDRVGEPPQDATGVKGGSRQLSLRTQ
jgi:DNA invertase Pin-like site-specific DNA recombinase